jgi:hypothetical protein
MNQESGLQGQNVIVKAMTLSAKAADAEDIRGRGN